MYSYLRSLLFRMQPENAHALVLNALGFLPLSYSKTMKGSPRKAMGLDFPHPVGLAAGLDKNGEYLTGLAKLGFSFIEVGTVTPRAQSGNPKPRLFRLPERQAIINRLGFNNKGVDVLIDNIEKSSYAGILGINIGKNKDTPLEQAAEDYLLCLRKVYPYASYITINISSPNTPDLRLLQQEKYLDQLLLKLIDEQKKLSDQYQRFVPLAVKLSPDETTEELKRIAELIATIGISAIIATNTTCTREDVAALPHGQEIGGLSGAPLLHRSTECLKIIKATVGNSVDLIGVGGIDSLAAAQEKMQAGANLLQVYTGLIYAGPHLVSELVHGLH